MKPIMTQSQQLTSCNVTLATLATGPKLLDLEKQKENPPPKQ